MSPYLILGIPLFSVFWSLYWLVVRPARKQRRASGEPRLPEGLVPPSAALAPPEPKAPRDTSRTYPRPGRTRSKLTRVCPVCGMEDPGNLDGKVFGWPAHRSCAEWLGDWRPERRLPVPEVAELRKALEDCATSHKVVVLPPGGVAIDVKTSPGTQVNVGNGNYMLRQVQNGLASLDEVRERLNREIVASWGVPSMFLQERTHKAGDPVPAERCPECGAQFVGQADYLRMAFRMHRQAGCR